MIFQNTLQLAEHEPGTYEITELISEIITESGVQTGTCQIYVLSSQAALIINDIADETTKNTTADFLAQLAPVSVDMGKRIDDSMEAIPKNMCPVISQNSISIPVANGRAGIGIWQGIYLWDQIKQENERKIIVTIIGE